MSGADSQAQAAAAFGAAPGPERPSKAGYWLGGGVIAGGVIVAFMWFVLGFVGLGDAVDDLRRVSVPGAAEVSLEDGKQSIYYEGPGGEDADVPRLQMSVVSAGSGAALRVGEHSGSVTYSVSGHAGRSVAGFDVPDEGRYRVSVEAPDGAPAGARLAVGPGIGGRIVRALVGAFVIFFVGAGVGTLLIVRTQMRRR